jgi:hypothetical protein
MAALTGPTAARRRQVRRDDTGAAVSDRSNTFGETTVFRWGLAYDPAVVVVTCGDFGRDGRGVFLSAPLGRLAGLGL